MNGASMSQPQAGHRVVIMVATAAIVVGAAVGDSLTRRGKPSMVFPPVDPATSCGPVSLSLVTYWLAHATAVDDLNELTRAFDSGICSLQDLKLATTSIGLTAETVRVDPARPLSWTLPTIVYLHGNHFVATLPITGSKLVFADPPNSPEVIDIQGLADKWDGTALVVASSQDELESALRNAGLWNHR